MKTFKYYLSLMLTLLVVLPMSATEVSGEDDPATLKCTEITPAAGDVKSLKEFVLTFASDSNSFAQVGGFKPNAKVRLYDDGDMSVAVGTLEKVSGIKNKNKAKVVLDQEVTASGDYYLFIPKGTVYDAHFDDTEEDLGVSLGAIYNPALRYDYSIKGETTYTINPDPAVELESVPGQVTVTVNKEIGNVDMAMVTLGPGAQLPVECNVEGNVLTVNLPVDNMQNIPGFSLMIYANDVDGNPLCYNDSEMIYIEYSVKMAANTYVCTEITPAEGVVSELKDFALTFVNYAAVWGDNIGGVDSTKTVELWDEYGTVLARGVVSVDYDNFSSVANISLDKTIVANGTYTLVVPEGTIYNSGYNSEEEDKGVANFGAIYNPQLFYTYTVEKAASVQVNPDPAKALSEVPAEIVFTFEKDIKKVSEAAVNLGSGFSIPFADSTVVVSGKNVTLKMPVEEISGFPGFVVVFVAEDVEGNLVTFGDELGLVKADYNIQLPANTFMCSEITPAEGEVAELTNFVMTFSGSEMVGGFDESKQIIVTNQMGQEVAKGTPSFSSDWSKALDVEIVLDQQIKEAGTYFLIIPEGTVYDGNFNAMEDDFGVAAFGATYNPELRYMYIVSGSGEVQHAYNFVSVNPAEGEVAELSKFEITLENPKDNMDFIGGVVDTKEVLLKNAAGEAVAKGKVSFDVSAWNSVFTVELDKVVKEQGTYTLVIPAGIVFNSAYAPDVEDHGASWGAICNTEIVLTYTVGTATGVEGLQIDNAVVNVYNLNGVLVGHSLSNLPKGVYVVNGHKVVVK